MGYDPIHDSVKQDEGNESLEKAESISDDANGRSPSLENSTAVEGSPSEYVNGVNESGEKDPNRGNDASPDITRDFENEHDEEDVGEREAEANELKKKGSDKQKKPVSVSKGSRHLKKGDGEPFWRKDIQYDFLKELFDDTNAVFTNSFPHCDIVSANNGPKMTFSELYIRNLAESSKCSKILKERLIKDTEMGKSVGKVCLLVNAGRMNTTINFVPEMRSSLRTYHSIPSLQADPEFGGSKPLQDTPRLKSILKAVCDTKEHITSLDALIANPSEEKPNTNVIELIFLMSGSVKAIKYQHDYSVSYNNNNNSFMEFFLNSQIHPKNRAQRFLWLLYTYLETNFTPDDLAQNPFNPDVIPPVELISEEDMNKFDQDTGYEIEYSEKMYQTRLRYLADEEHNSNPKRGNKSKKDRDRLDPDDSIAHEDADTSLDLHDSSIVEDRKRPTSSEDSKAKRRKGKRNPAIMASSPLGSAQNEHYIDKNHDLDVSDTENFESGVEKSSDSDYLRSDNILIKFPIEGLEKLAARFQNPPSRPLLPDESLSYISRTNVINKSKQIIRQVRNSSKSNGIEFLNKTDLLKKWLFKFFQYKKSSANGLLGMEWEDIRYDYIHGVEGYTYHQLGKLVGNSSVAPSRKGDWHSDIDGQIDIANVEDMGEGYIPIHSFNRGNEKTSYILELISYYNEWYQENAKTEYHDIKFDLDNDSLDFR